MAATDYVIVTGWQNAYLAKKKKPTKKGLQTMTFTAWWIFNIHPHLNGFSGLDTIPIKCNF